jgi:hypothetical protein
MGGLEGQPALQVTFFSPDMAGKAGHIRRKRGFAGAFTPPPNPHRVSPVIEGKMERIVNEKMGQWMGIGIAIGVALGASLGLLLDNLALGIGVGVAIGTALGAAFSAQKGKD